MNYYSISKEEWDKKLEKLVLSHTIFATVSNEFGQDYELVTPSVIPKITYNNPKPATSLKTFFLPAKENVTSERKYEKPRIIIGAPNCDVEGLNLLDEIYLDNDFYDIFFSNHRKNTFIISSDCFSSQENCHCISYGIKPFTTRTADLSVILLNGSVIFRCISGGGEDFINNLISADKVDDKNVISEVERRNNETEVLLSDINKNIPDYAVTGKLIETSDKHIWEKYSSDCVSCGACATICTTCSCFLLIDKPGFEKVKQMDACQYPGFERVAGGEDVLNELPNRFRNRYMCKYVWRPKTYKSIACTGCGRCIDACLGKINKNELFKELSQ
jgi:sulfhydrogenase subunit beta (sulfur reductase)